MSGTSTTQHVNAFLTILMTAIINLMTVSCQTLQKEPEKADHKTEVLDTQKALVVSLLNKGLPNMAYKELRELIRKHPQDPDFHNLMGLTNLALQNPTQAINFFNAAYKIDKKPSYVLNLSSALIETKNYNKAITLLNGFTKHKAFKDYPYPERVYHNIGLSYERMGKLAQAESNYKKAIDQNANYFISHMKLANVYEQTKRLVLAKDAYTTAFGLCPSCSDPALGLSQVYNKMGQQEKALKLLANYLTQTEIAPGERARVEQQLSQVKAAILAPNSVAKSSQKGNPRSKK